MSGKRETTPHRQRRQSSGLAGWWRQHREWVAGLDRRQKLRYRLFQTLVILSVLVIGVWLGLKMWMKLPEIPDPSGGTGTTQGASQPLLGLNRTDSGTFTDRVRGANRK